MRVTAALPADGHTSGTGRAGEVAQEIECVPAAWLEELARRLGCDLTDVCRGLIPDE